jgi:PKD domain
LVAVLAVLGVSAPAAQASLSVPSQTFTSLTQFEAAAGGTDKGTTVGEQGSGFRHFTPGVIAVNGSDPGTTAIPGGHTAALASTRLEPWGIELGPNVAVANDGFTSVNPKASFSTQTLWAPYNSNTTSLQVVAPGAQGSAPVPALTRGLGVTLVNVEAGTMIQYYSVDGLLETDLVSGPPGATAFAGVLFGDPVVTRVVITLGTTDIFGFDGTSVTAGGTDPATLTAADDLVLAEPGAGEAAISATAGVPISPVLESFGSNDPVGDIAATIDWGDGSRSTGGIVPGATGTFSVSGSHSYALPGSYTARLTVQDSSGSELETQALIQVAPEPTTASLSCSPPDVAVSAITTCTAAVQDADAGAISAPTGLVTLSSPTAGASFPGTGSCVLGASGSRTAFCEVQFRPGQLPPAQARITASYGGDGAHGASSSETIIGVHIPSCSVRALSRRLGSGGFALLVTCNARTNVQIGAQAQATRSGQHDAFQLKFGSLRTTVTAGRPTVLVIKAAPGVLPALRAALHRHQRVSLKLTLTAGSGAKRKTTTTRVAALRLS